MQACVEDLFPNTKEDFKELMNAMNAEWQFSFVFCGVDGLHLPIKCPHRCEVLLIHEKYPLWMDRKQRSYHLSHCIQFLLEVVAILFYWCYFDIHEGLEIDYLMNYRTDNEHLGYCLLYSIVLYGQA